MDPSEVVRGDLPYYARFPSINDAGKTAKANYHLKIVQIPLCFSQDRVPCRPHKYGVEAYARCSCNTKAKYHRRMASAVSLFSSVNHHLLSGGSLTSGSTICDRQLSPEDPPNYPSIPCKSYNTLHDNPHPELLWLVAFFSLSLASALRCCAFRPDKILYAQTPVHRAHRFVKGSKTPHILPLFQRNEQKRLRFPASISYDMPRTTTAAPAPSRLACEK